MTRRGWLESLQGEAENAALRCGLMRGAVLVSQRPWSTAIDTIEHARQEIAEGVEVVH